MAQAELTDQRSEAARLLRGPGPRVRTPDSKRYLKAQADEKEAKAELAKIKLQLERGEIVPRKVMDDHDAAVASYFRRWALGLSKDWPPRLIGLNEKEMATVIDRQARDLLTRMARMSPTPERKEDDHEPEN